VNPHNLSIDLRRKLFKTIIFYHQRTLQWLPFKLALSLTGFFDSSLENILKESVIQFEQKKEEARFVPLGNIAYVVGILLEAGINLDRDYWRTHLITYAADINENGVLQRHALSALQHLSDPTVIDELPDLTESNELIAREFLGLCTELDPDNPKCLEYFFKSIKRDNFYGRYGIFKARKAESVKAFLITFNTDEDFRREFLKDAALFKDKDHILVENIELTLTEEIRGLCKGALAHCVHYNIAHYADHSIFILDLWKLLRKSEPNVVQEMIKRIVGSQEGKARLYFAHNFFAEVIQEGDVAPFIEAMISEGEMYSALSVMQQIKLSNRKDAIQIYEAGRSILGEDYKDWEARIERPESIAKSQEEKLLREFNLLLDPMPGRFSDGVFEYYNQNRQHLDQIIETDQKNRLASIITGTIFKFIDPVKYGLTITSENSQSKSFTTDMSVQTFGAALITAKYLGIDIMPFRQHIINFIPFAYDEHLNIIFDLVKDVTPAEMSPILNVYRDKKTDLWRHQTISFVEAVEKYHVIEALSILKEFVKERACDIYTRTRALVVVDALSSTPIFLEEIFKSYQDSIEATEKNLAHRANSLLITSHANSNAIRWRLFQLLERAAPFTPPSGAHMVSDIEAELGHGKTFAKPLMDLKQPGYEENYLDLLNNAMKIWAKGSEFHAYAIYLWEIVYSYFENLKEKQSFEPLRQLETKIAKMKDQNGANWLAARMVHLRRSYLSYLGKPRNISEAVRRYNGVREYEDKKIINSNDLFRHLQDALQTDLKRWIEGEGAYDLILGEKVYEGKKQEYEKLIQKTLKAQVENILHRRGFHVDVVREPELLDGKKVDFYVRYGFVGPVVVEVKLTSNSDLKGTQINKSLSYLSMEHYMKGYMATHGIVLVINNTNARNLLTIKEEYQRIPNVWVQSFDCSRTFPDSNRLFKKSPSKKATRKNRPPRKS